MELSLHFSQNNRQMAPTWTVIQTTVLKNFQLNCLVNEQCINNILHELLTVKVTTLIALKYFAFCRFTAVSRKIHLFIATPIPQFPSPPPLPRGNAIIRALTSQHSWFSWQLSILMCCLGYGIWFEIQERILISLSATISSFFLASRVEENYKLISTLREYGDYTRVACCKLYYFISL